MPDITKNWCSVELAKLSYSCTKVNASEYFPDSTRAHCRVYLQLRETLRAHIISGKKPHLSLCEKPTGAWDWNPDLTEVEDVGNANIYGEGEDLLAMLSNFIDEELEVEI